jgi:folate-binding protein YgfZ
MKIILTGGDRTRWLNGMVTNNIRDLAPGRGVYSFLLSPQGHILADMNIYNCGDYLLVDTDASQGEKVRATFEHYIIMDDVELADSSDKFTTIVLEGPKSRDVLSGAGLHLPETEPIFIEATRWNNIDVTAVHIHQNAFELWVHPAHAQQLWDALITAGATPVGTEAQEMWRITEGIPRYGQDIRERELPQETAQDRALSFTKGCYVGQEIVERIRSRGAVHRTFTRFRFTGALPAVGTKVTKDGRDVGEITSVVTLPSSAGPIHVGLGYIRREAATPDAKLDASGVETTVSALPISFD